MDHGQTTNSKNILTKEFFKWRHKITTQDLEKNNKDSKHKCKIQKNDKHPI